jgi:hypothetical protein
VEMKQMFRFVVDRRKGKGMNLIKFHLLDHIAQDCLDMGSPVNTSGGPGETNQKPQKAAGKRTQMTESSFNYQQSKKLAEANSIRTAGIQIGLRAGSTAATKSKMLLHSKEPAVEKKADIDGCSGNHYTIFVSSKGKCCFRFTGYGYGNRGKSHNQDKEDGCLSSQYHAVHVIMRKIKQQIKDNWPKRDMEIPVYTELRKTDSHSEQQLFRADPIYRNMDGNIEQRADWCFTKWEYHNIRTPDEFVGCQLLCFLECNKSNQDFFEKEGGETRMHALFHSLERELPLSYDLAGGHHIDISAMQHPSSRLLFKGKITREDQTRLPKIYIDEISCIVDPAIVIRDINPTWDGRSSRIQLHRSAKEEVLLEYILVRRRRQWSDVFQLVCQRKYGEKKHFVPNFKSFLDEKQEEKD